MDANIKEETPIEIEGYVIVDTTSQHNYSSTEDDCDSRSSKKRKLSEDNADSARASSANDEMLLLLQQWGLEILHETFAKNLIDLSVLDYLLDVDIVDLCRDYPMRYRVILRHKLAEKRGKCVNGCSSPVDTNRAEMADDSTVKSASSSSIVAQLSRMIKNKPPPNQAFINTPKREGLCTVDMVLNKPFATRSDEEKRLLVSVDIPRPDLPDLKTTYTNKNKLHNRQFARSKYDATWWLCGSQKRNKVYCWPCLLFHQRGDTGVWHTKGLNDLNHLSASIKSHSQSSKHVDNVNAFVNFGKSATGTDGANSSDTRTKLPKSNVPKVLPKSDIPNYHKKATAELCRAVLMQ